MLAVYEYGLIQPTEGEKIVNDQIYLAHQYYNKLVEIEQERRKAVVEAQLEFPHIAKAQEEYEKANNLVQELMKQKKLAKSYDKKVEAPPQEQIKLAKEARKIASENAKKAKAEEKEKLVPVYQTLEETFQQKYRALRKDSGLYWGNYLITEQAFDAARKATMSLGELNKKKNPQKKKYTLDDWMKMPRFKKWTGHGAVAVQIQKGMNLSDVWGGDTRLRIDPLPDNAFDKSISRGKRKKLQRTMVHLRVESSHDKKPIWATWPLFMHRELPEGTIIKWAKVIRVPWYQRWKYQWKLQLTIEVPEPQLKSGRSMVAVNAGWRKMEDGELRVATWADIYGNTGEVRLDASFRKRIEKAESIRGFRDKNLDKLRDFLMEQNIEGLDCSKWKSHKRFHRLIKDQGENFPENVMQTLKEWYERPSKPPVIESWSERDNHLWWYERGCRSGALNYRREIYRLFALEIAERYDIIVVENYDLREIVEDPNRIQEPSAQRVEGSPSELRGILRSTANRLGCLVIDGESKLATQQCFLCGYEEPWDAASDVMHTCAGCGAEWDQDINNARNMLERAKKDIAEALLAQDSKPTKYTGRFHKKSA
jgi:hypothetical protein